MAWNPLNILVRDRRGISTVEFAFAAPTFLALLAAIAQFGMGFFIKNHMQDVARDTTRQVAVGAMSEVQAEQYALSSLLKLGASFSADVVPPTNPGGSVTTVISVPMTDLALFDFLGIMDEGTVEVSVTMKSE